MLDYLSGIYPVFALQVKVYIFMFSCSWVLSRLDVQAAAVAKRQMEQHNLPENDSLDPTISTSTILLNFSSKLSLDEHEISRCDKWLKIEFYLWQQYLANRLRNVESLRESGINPYPNKFFITMSIPEFISRYAHLNTWEFPKDIDISLAGAQVMISVKSWLEFEFNNFY